MPLCGAQPEGKRLRRQPLSIPEALLEKTLFTPVCGEPVALSMQLPLDGEGLLIDWVSRHTESGFAIELDEASPAPERLASYVAGVVPVRPEPNGSPDT